MKPQPMKSYRLLPPSPPGDRHGQGPLPKSWRYIAGDGEETEIPYGSVAEARERCHYPAEWSEMEGKWLVHIDFLKTTKTRWEQL